MTNHRRGDVKNLYRYGFLRSPAWFARRDSWFTAETRITGLLVCAGCGELAGKDQLELHHLDYSGVTLESGRWRAHEEHDDLTPMHPYCHDLLHRLLDRDTVLAKHRDRRTASLAALERLRIKLTSETS
ncbi:hypothetical protein M4I32_12895 [Microbacterium sp. LRZ72]|uniref:hypothetical protein n=1 Tax=Microbacterium sp. LRZ72 TaxID=2942481 RepID=UPI0029AD53D8|nr:hypothetical protein [Microbacterium sp. LRZ72]MDX2377699.1 hypothetical protein [Microbacterium sp. LRZ72]